MRNNKMKGFTLVELLVVIAILAILATVSVVGYTSFIKSAHISNDENIAAQLNQFLAAYQADHTTEHYGKPITEDNIWEITQTILKDSQLDELEPHAKDYGYHYYFKFDRQGGGEYVAADENNLRISAFTRVVRFFVSADTPKSNYAGVFYDEAFNKYFLCDTKGSPIAEAIKGFHTFKDIDGTTSAEQFANFKTLVMDLNQELYGDLKKLAESGVFVTKEGNFAFDRNAEHSNLFFHEDATFVGNTIKDAENELLLGADKPLLKVTEATTINIPNGVKLPANSLNIANEGQKATVVLNAKSWDEVVDIVDAYFTDAKVVVELAGVKYEIYGNDVCAYTADETKGEVVYVLKYNNSLQDFDIEILDKDDNQLLNGTKLVGEETIKAGFAAWDKGSFKLQLANATGKNDSAISSLDVEWKVISGPATISQDGTLTFTGNYDLSYDKVVVSATATIDREGYASTSAKFNAENVAYNEYVIYIAGPQGYTVEIDNRGAYAPVDATLTNRTYNIGLAKEAAAGNTYSFKLTIADNENVISGVAVDYSNVAVTFTCSEHGTSCENVIVTSNSINVKGACSGVITVKVGDYFIYTVNLTTVDVSNLPVQIKNNGIVLGNLNEVVMSDLFKPATGDTFPAGAELKVFQKVNTGDSYAIPNRTDMYTSNTNGVTCWITNNDDASIKFNGTRTDDVHVAVFLNGQRISPDVQITDIVEAYNINDYDDFATAENHKVDGVVTGASMVLVNEITMPGILLEKIQVKAGKTLYGNYYTIKLPAPIAGDSNKRSYAYIELAGATMVNTRVLGTVYSTLALSAQDNTGMGLNAVHAMAGSSIENCYIANTRSPLVAGNESDTADKKVTVKDSVLYGGRYCNVDLRGGTLEFQGDVITVNQPDNDDSTTDIIGTGVNIWLKAKEGTNLAIASGATWTPYNFIANSDANKLPTSFNVKATVSGHDFDISLPLNLMFKSIFGECIRNHTHKGESGYNWILPCCNKVDHEIEGSLDGIDVSIAFKHYVYDCGVTKTNDQYEKYIFTSNGKRYVNAAYLSMNGEAATLSGAAYTTATYSILNAYNIDICTLDPAYKVTVEGKDTTPNYNLLTASLNAATTYAPANYGFVGGDLAPLTSN